MILQVGHYWDEWMDFIFPRKDSGSQQGVPESSEIWSLTTRIELIDGTVRPYILALFIFGPLTTVVHLPKNLYRSVPAIYFDWP